MEMQNNHTHTSVMNLSNAFKLGIVINIVFIITEVLYGFFSNSMALIADAGHNFSDVMALGFSWTGVALSQRKPTLKFTYGFRRSTILIAILNTILLLIAVTYIIKSTVERFGNPVNINSGNVIIVAAIGIVVNGFTAWLFFKDKEHDLNIRSAFLHFIADALVSLGVVVAGIVMALTGTVWVDSLISIVIIAVILYSSYHLLIDSVNLALDAVPDHINIQAVREYLLSLTEVDEVHDLHIWALSTTDAALTVHIVTKSNVDNAFIPAVTGYLHQYFHIGHCTLQIEHCNSIPCQEPCN
jgi:cobalt-zinc-cadmium efflux system protein